MAGSVGSSIVPSGALFAPCPAPGSPAAPLPNEFAAMEGSMLRAALRSGRVRDLARRCRKPLI
jgi:hypothetical protein